MSNFTLDKQIALIDRLVQENVSKETRALIMDLMGHISRLEANINDYKRSLSAAIATQEDTDRFIKAAFERIGL